VHPGHMRMRPKEEEDGLYSALPPEHKVPSQQHNIKSQSLCLPYAYHVHVSLTTSIWAKNKPLVEHQEHHVEEQEAHEDNLWHKLTVNVDTSLEVSGKQEQ